MLGAQNQTDTKSGVESGYNSKGYVVQKAVLGGVTVLVDQVVRLGFADLVGIKRPQFSGTINALDRAL